MILALCQLNYTVGDFNGNADKIITTIHELKNKKVELAVFSELSVCGYPPLDLLEKDEFVEECLKSVSKIAQECKGIAAIVGSPSFNMKCSGKRLHNTAFYLAEGTVKKMIHKTLLPDYDVFDEYRFFADGGTKQVTLETGIKVNTPLFVKEGDILRINTETREYVERVNK